MGEIQHPADEIASHNNIDRSSAPAQLLNVNADITGWEGEKGR